MKYQLIIFDLDDTLIETSKCFLPLELKNALQAMMKAGLDIDNLEESHSLLLKINERSGSGHEALAAFLEQIHGDKMYLDVAIKSYYRCDSLHFNMETLPMAKEVLLALKKDALLALVSKGIDHVQRLKMEKAGIDEHWFSTILITLDYDKKKSYQAILQKHKIDAEKMIVIGDKVDGDLLPGKELGMATVFMNHGLRAKHFPPKKGEADFTINDLPELIPIVQGYMVQGHKVQGHKVQGHKVQGNKVQGNKVQGNKVQGNKKDDGKKDDGRKGDGR